MEKQNKVNHKRENFNLTNEEEEIFHIFILSSIACLKTDISSKKLLLKDIGYLVNEEDIKEDIRVSEKLKSVLSKFLSGQIKNY